MTDNMIYTNKLTKCFGDNLAVDRLSLEIPAGEVFGLLGPNGAGKTTTIRMLSALIGPTSGEARVGGYDVTQDGYMVRKSVGILTETPGLYNQLSAERNLSFFAKLYEVADIPAQVEKYLRMLGLWDRRHEEVGTFSKGMRQKLAIARALLHEPKILYLDEPTSGLDPQASRIVREFIAGLRQEGRTIIICTHNLSEADRLCDRVAVFRSKLLALDTPTNLRRQIFGRMVVFHLTEAQPGLAEVVGGVDFVQKAEIVENKLVITLDDPEAQNPTLVKLLVEHGAEIRFVGELRRSLEDVYLHLVNAPMAEEREED
ncbi:MAG: ABC transporter ATP-binding protein [Anaerolineales bacterium]|nr:ABC transporter ATP-binding protein [Anaerolineales bacterium]